MMNSAAVIGRQLRQQAVAGRSSGPLLPTHTPFGKNRPRAPSHALIPPRPHSPIPPSTNTQFVGTNYPVYIDQNQFEPTVIKFPIQAPSERFNVTSKLTTGTAINAVLAQREQKAIANQLRKLDLQNAKPKLRCTWHCFCVAFKALSGGLFLLIVGTIMSIVGFMLEADFRKNYSSENMSSNTEEVKTRIRNLTYAGPVIMGLGGIMIVAALVLTFEVRDTLGVKDNGERDGNMIVEKKQRPKNLFVLERKEDINLGNNKINCSENALETENNDLKELEILDQLPDKPLKVCTIENELRKLSLSRSSSMNKLENIQLDLFNENEENKNFLKENTEFETSIEE